MIILIIIFQFNILLLCNGHVVETTKLNMISQYYFFFVFYDFLLILLLVELVNI